MLGLVGLVLAAAGVLALLVDNGTIPWSETPGSLYRRAAGDAVGSVDLAAAIATAVCLVVLLLGLRWATVQLRPVSDGPKLGTLKLGAGQRGRTTVPAVTVAKAASADLASLHGVISARVRLLAVRPVPRAVVTIEVALDADPIAVRAEAGAALGRLAATLGATTVDSDLRIRFGRELRTAKTARVR